MTSTAKSQGPLFTRRALFTLIWPLLLEQTLSVTMGMADTLMVAGVGEAAVRYLQCQFSQTFHKK